MNRKSPGIKIIFLLLFFFLQVNSLLAQEVPVAYDWVNDYAGVISSEYKEKIIQVIKNTEENTSAEIAVVTIESIAPYSEVDYARKLFDTWKPGKIKKDNGVLVLLAIKERRWRIETGYGVEGILPDGLCGQIGRDFMVPYFKQGKYSEGLFYGVSEVSRILGGGAPSPVRSQRIPVKAANPFIYVFCFIFFLIWNLPWPIFIGLPFTLLFAFAFGKSFPGAGALIIVAYIFSMIIRYNFWKNLPPENRPRFLGPQNYRGGTSGRGGFSSGGFSGGGFGGFGGGGGGGGGAGGGF
jgi:uncharacterized protein